MTLRTLIILCAVFSIFAAPFSIYTQALAEDEPIIKAGTLKREYAEINISRTKRELAKLEKQLREISASDARVGESLNDEIARKRKETKSLRDKIKKLNEKIEKYKKDLEDAKREESREKEGESRAYDAYYDAEVKYKNYKGTGYAADMAKIAKARSYTTSCTPCADAAKRATSLDKSRYDAQAALPALRREYLKDKLSLAEKHERLAEQAVKADLKQSAALIARSIELDDNYNAQKKKLTDKIAKLKAQLANAEAQLAACEKKCAAETTDGTALKAGEDVKPVKPKSDKDGKKRPGEVAGLNTGQEALKSYKKNLKDRFKAVKKPQVFKTSCKHCKSLAKTATRLDDERHDIETQMIHAEGRYLRKRAEVEATSGSQGWFGADRKGKHNPRALRELSLAGYKLSEVLEVEEAYKAEVKEFEAALAKVKEILAQTLSQLSACEKQWCNIEDKYKKIIGSLGGAKPFPPLPFAWKGPYNTTCKPCIVFAGQLNHLPRMVRERQLEKAQLENIDLNNLQKEREELKGMAAPERLLNENAADIDRVKKRIRRLNLEIDKVRQLFPQLLKKLRACEREKCKDHSREDVKVGCVLPYGSPQIFVPAGGAGTGGGAHQNISISPGYDGVGSGFVSGSRDTFLDPDNVGANVNLEEGADSAYSSLDVPLQNAGEYRDITTDDILSGTYGDCPEVELEYVVSITGTNPLSPQEIERIPGIVTGTDTTPVSTPVVVTPAVPTTPVTTPTTPVTTPTTPTTTFSTSGVSNFLHTVGSSPCPQSAGNITITSSSGNPLTVSGLGAVSGTLATRLNVSIGSNGSVSPQIVTQFNCSSAANGSFSGSFSFTVTDTVTGDSQTFTINATGTVTG